MVHLINTTPEPNQPTSDVLDVGADNFMEEVIEKSKTIPVLVDFWAPWCEPCKNLTPILENLAKKYANAFQLVKINIDEQQELAMQFQVRSVPTVYLMKDATVVDGFMGAQPQQVIEQFLSKHITVGQQSPEPIKKDPIQDLIDRGQVAEAIATLETDDSKESQYRLARLHLDQNNFDRTHTILDQQKDDKSSPEHRSIAGALHFAEIAYEIESVEQLHEDIAQNDQNWDASYQLAALHMASGNFAQALDLLLRIVMHDRRFNDDAGRKGMISAFDMIGDDHELVTQYRRSLARTLH